MQQMDKFNVFSELINDITGCMSTSKYVNCTLDKMGRHNRKLISLTKALLQYISGSSTAELLSHCLTLT